MNLDQFRDFVRETPREAWIYNEITRDGVNGVFTNTRDLEVRIHAMEVDYSDKFTEEWATRHVDSDAHEARHELWYGSSLVDSETLIIVDGGRSMIPMVRSREDLTITPWQYAVGCIVNRLDAFDDYLQRCGITVRAEDEA